MANEQFKNMLKDAEMTFNVDEETWMKDWILQPLQVKVFITVSAITSLERSVGLNNLQNNIIQIVKTRIEGFVL